MSRGSTIAIDFDDEGSIGRMIVRTAASEVARTRPGGSGRFIAYDGSRIPWQRDHMTLRIP